MPRVQLAMPLEQFRQLPRHPAYHYEFLQGTAHLDPRPIYYHAILDLRAMEVIADVDVRRVEAEDWAAMEAVFAAAFSGIQPFGGLAEPERREAARKCLEQTRDGRDGPWIDAASRVAWEEDQVVGAVLITLVPPGDPGERPNLQWDEPPPVDAVARHLGRPHLTWAFVTPHRHGQGVGTALLAAAVNALMDLGYTELLTTIMAGNESSLLWHWRNGFGLLPGPASQRPGQRWRPRHY